MTGVFRWLTLRRLLSILTIFAVFVIAIRAPLDTDTLWHLRAGEWQVQEHALLRVDLFSHSRTGMEWINHSWLSQLAIYAMYALLGDVGLGLFTGLLAAGGMIFVFKACEGDLSVRSAAVLLGASTAAIFWSARPQMFSFFLAAVVYYLLWLYQKKGIDRLWLIPSVMLVWANLHGGFAIGFILLVLGTIGETARWVVQDVFSGNAFSEGVNLAQLKPIWRLVIVGLVSVVAISINPYGLQMVAYPFRTVGIGVLRDFIQEWAAPNFHDRSTWPFIWLLLGTLALAGLSKKRLDWRDAIYVTGLAYAALLAGRNMSVFAIVAAPVFAEHFDSWLAEQGVHFQWDRVPRGALAVANWALLILAVVAGVIKISNALDANLIAEARADFQPVQAAEVMLEMDAPRELFNSYNWGGYLIWTTRDYPVFVDGRTDLYDDELLMVYLETTFAQDGWEDNLVDLGINTVLIESGGSLARMLALTEGWELVYQDNVASLFIREDVID